MSGELSLAQVIATLSAELGSAEREAAGGSVRLDTSSASLVVDVAFTRSSSSRLTVVAAAGRGSRRRGGSRVTITLQPVRRLSETLIAERLAELPDGGSGVPAQDYEQGFTPARWACREAAALLGAFTVGSLRPVLDAQTAAALNEFVAGDCERVMTVAGGRWRLMGVVRESTIKRLNSQGRLGDALDTAALEEFDVGGLMARAYVRGTAPPLDRQSPDELQGTLQAVEWLSAAGIGLPSDGEIHQHLALAALLSPLRVLAGEHFVGRETELRRLADYVEVLPPSSLRGHLTRGVRRVLGLAERPPLVIHGPGGIGKSTLVARFTLDHAELEADRRFPFAYLSFDRSDLNPRQPLTLLAEAVKQLGVLFPGNEEPVSSLEHAIQAALVSEYSRVQRARPAERDLMEGFARLVTSVTKPQPNLWILDTFEQAQLYGRDGVARLWEFLDQLQAALPWQRTVFSGRAPIEGYPTDQLHLSGLDKEVARGFLATELSVPGFDDRFLDAVVARIGTNPLSLKLAAELLRREGEPAIRQVDTRRMVFFRLATEEIQGLLYRRILDHLEDPNLQKIANPGLVVRRVTPGIIAEVLAVPCGLGPIGADRARSLFDRLSREASLVEHAADGALVHRVDVRRTMLPMLTEDSPERVRSIHRRAVRFYHRLSGAQAKAEEMYHRLMLGQSTRTLDQNWDPAAGAFLENALDELPVGSRVYLADRLGITLDASTLSAADDEAWARQVARTARGLLDDGGADRALSLIQERANRSAWPAVAALEIEALATLGEVDRALDIADSSLSDAPDEGQAAEFIQLAMTAARIAEDAGRFELALRWLQQARAAADVTNAEIPRLAADVGMLRLYRRSGAAGERDDPDFAVARTNALRQALSLSRQEQARNPKLVRDMAAEVGADAPVLLATAAQLTGIDLAGQDGDMLRDLVPATEMARFDDFVAQQQSRPLLTTLDQGVLVAAYLSAQRTADPEWRTALTKVFQFEADRPAFT